MALKFQKSRSWKGSKHMRKNISTNNEIYVFDKFPSNFKSLKGTLSYSEIQKDKAKEILKAPIKSFIKNKDLLTKLFTEIGIDLPYNDIDSDLEHGNECLVIKSMDSKLHFFRCIIRYTVEKPKYSNHEQSRSSL